MLIQPGFLSLERGRGLLGEHAERNPRRHTLLNRPKWKTNPIVLWDFCINPENDIHIFFPFNIFSLNFNIPSPPGFRQEEGCKTNHGVRKKTCSFGLRTRYFIKNISRTSAVSLTNFRSILIFASCVVGTCNILYGWVYYWEGSYF